LLVLMELLSFLAQKLLQILMVKHGLQEIAQAA
jgi:hypothetical protein